MRPFERGQLKDGDVIADCLDCVGHPEAIPGLTRVDANTSLSALAVYLLDSANRQLPRRRRNIEAAAALSEIAGPSYTLPAEALEDVRRRAAPELAFLERDYGVRLEEPRVTPTPPPALSAAEIDSLALLLVRSVQSLHEAARTPVSPDRASRLVPVLRGASRRANRT